MHVIFRFNDGTEVTGSDQFPKSRKDYLLDEIKIAFKENQPITDENGKTRYFSDLASFEIVLN